MKTPTKPANLGGLDAEGLVAELSLLECVFFGLPLYLAGVMVASESREDATLCCKRAGAVEDGATCAFEISWSLLPVIEGRIAVTIVALKYKSAYNT